jgi:hypothetical protein
MCEVTEVQTLETKTLKMRTRVLPSFKPNVKKGILSRALIPIQILTASMIGWSKEFAEQDCCGKQGC